MVFDKNCEIKYPCAPCISTPSKPASAHRFAAAVKSLIILLISSWFAFLENPDTDSLHSTTLAETG